MCAKSRFYSIRSRPRAHVRKRLFMKLLKSQIGNATINVDAISIIYVKSEKVLTKDDTQHNQKYVLCCNLIGNTHPVYLLSSNYDNVIHHKRKLELALVSTGDNQIIDISELHLM